MPKQVFKSIYFSDFPAVGTKAKSFKIAISAGDQTLHSAVSGLSSCEMRNLLGVGSYAELALRANEASKSVNAYCIETVRRQVVQKPAVQLSIFDSSELGRHCTASSVRHLPIHRWFGWLEGYSPAFVEEALRLYAPHAASVLDPFAGSGTTPITAIGLGKASFYCEVNPLLQLIIRAKTLAVTVSEKRRALLVHTLRQLSYDLRDRVSAARPDTSLDQSYHDVFGKSTFFSRDGYSCVLRMRSLLDEVIGADSDAGTLFAVSILSAMLPSSLLTRAGDVRFRRDDELTQMTELVEGVTTHLDTIIDDLENATELPFTPTLLAADARDLAKLPAVNVDAVVTSPPYLNGTNYFRNTKLELWFLRALRVPSDLKAFRRRSITAGINDVTVGRSISRHDCVLDLVAILQEKAYDARIARMVGSYFLDMEQVLAAVAHHLRPSSRLVLDIGDSVYAGVRVPTDEILTRIADSLGFKLLETRHLRTRVSRDKTLLKQVLLVLEWPGDKVFRRPAAWEAPKAWSSFLAEEPHKQAPYSARNWGHSLHSLCSYQGKLKPGLAHHLVKTFSTPGQALLDPFGGVGTIPLEGALSGVRTFSFDISPAAHTIARAKLARVDSSKIVGVLDDLTRFLSQPRIGAADWEQAALIRFNKPLNEYFHPKTLEEILAARKFFLESGPGEPEIDFVRACLLHILHGNRPYALSRRSHPITPFAPSGPYEYKSLMQHLRTKVNRVLREPLPAEFAPGQALQCDATGPWPQDLPELDAIITSPPFFDSTRFYLANWMRLWFSGWDIETFRRAPASFIDERQKKGFSVYEPILRQARERLKPGSPLVLHLGRSKKCDMGFEIARLAKPWFRLVDRYAESVRDCESHGIRDKGTVTDHEILVFV